MASAIHETNCGAIGLACIAKLCRVYSEDPARTPRQKPMTDPATAKEVAMEQRILLLVILAVCICMELVGTRPAWAQPGPSAQRIEQIVKQLNLTPQQKMALMPVLTAEAPEVEAIRSDSSLSDIQKLERLKALHARTDPQVRSILNPQQYQKLQEIRNREIQQAARKKLQ
jgi:hypothetical protein